jgi:hypothetical protein
MKRLLCSMMLTLVVVVPSAAQSQTMSASMNGAGPNGFDWAIGTWSCTNNVPSSMGGPSSQTLNVTKTSSGALLYHAAGKNYDNSWYNVYVPKTKMWVSPFILADGTYGTESTNQTGKTIVWTGTAIDASGTTTQIRDTNVYEGTKYTDLGEYRSAGAWKTQYNVTCTKT